MYGIYYSKINLEVIILFIYLIFKKISDICYFEIRKDAKYRDLEFRF